jgi:L-amino acid N-acyltransferase YncA
MDVAIREVRPTDASAIVDILNPIIEARTFTVLDTPLTVEGERAFIANFPARGVFHVAERSLDSRIIGIQDVEPFAGYTHALDHVGVIGTFIEKDFRRQGVGKRLFEATFDAARRKGYEKLFTYVRADNDAALSAYLAQGFSIVGSAKRHAKIDGRYIDETIIERLL